MRVLVCQLSLYAKKLKHLKPALRRWNAECFGNIQTKIKILQAEIDHLQHKLSSPEVDFKENALQSELQEQLIREEILWKNKSRVTWLSMPKLNTKFFHISTLIRQAPS